MATILPLQRDRRGAERTPARADVRLALTRRGRMLVVVLAFVLGLAVAALSILVLDLPSAFAGPESNGAISITVQPGDTLWAYANEHAPEGVSAQEYVNEVRALNHLPTGRITAGQSIQLPVGSHVGR